ncbi:IS66 family insertion sequence element accessory protein TnpB (plasmid) [Sinorhizobium meliloti]|nr:IS66 family insertion sequence element accessory protein TnpB [Sinorhizobium meliloti]
MIASGVVVYVSCQPVDFRKGAASLMALVRDGGLDPFNGALYVFRSKRADRVRIVWWDGSGVCLYSKNPRGAELLLAGHIGRQDTSGPFAINGASGRSGLEEDPANQGQTAVADGLNRTAAR